ncbi:cyclic peptide export ABC transporter [Myxococcus landrumensis]|uniref:Cyclic peptide export ABC transporter n=1 Tax=Myxococcus landrumensis TaxID=2813577 RepID=A0ABX7NAM6_9BACT|nr:cyclic peptide export ABC transporter [Myxococcus landrumus]QSQ15444.1 cyclic peptide export ABC transporter [Myxococcus landrumus]
MKLVLFLIQRAKGRFALATLFGLLGGAMSAALIAVISNALSGATPTGPGGMLTFAVLATLGLVTRFFSQVVLNSLHQGELQRLRLQLGRQILATPLRRLEEAGPHRLQSALSNDIQAMSSSMGLIPVIFIDLTVVLGCLGYMAWLSSSSFLGTVVFLLVGGLIYWIPQERGVSIVRQAHGQQSLLFKCFRGITDGIKELKLNQARRAAFIKESFEPTTSALHHAHVRASRYYAAATNWGTFIFLVFIGLMIYAAPHVLDVSAKELMGYTLTALYLQQPLTTLMRNVPVLSQGNIALEHLKKLTLSPPDTSAPLLQAPRSFERLEVAGITHTYFRDNDDSRFTLGPIHLELVPGEIVFIIGGNGSGKTTLAKLLTGLYTPEAGELRIDGRPVTDENREQYQQYFSAVFSDFHLFDSLLGLAPAERAQRLQGYLERLQLDKKVSINEAGVLSTTDLSLGQRKRLALLASWLEDRPIYLFDEWAADQDPAFKNVFYLELLQELKRAGKSVVVISHDNHYFHVADRIIQLDSGRLLEAPSASPKAEPLRATVAS